MAALAAAGVAAAAAATDPNSGGGCAAATGTANEWQGREWQWAGGDAVLIQLGDVVDRGPDSLALLRRVEGLKIQARAVGGDVVMLLGNHELMNIYYDFSNAGTCPIRS
ncbi:hypothetical protein Vretimale_4949 [Volvox reticuliferus]|uniref:Calcineurin-like phosphoesterase domain-containing protein n=1 Tax=Volvox reticuliferus TaxID=1737510 RepID=A0A8J4G4N4_9CHLO|nr:hypothetical protein Vretimale_4949 [Volvox reticuliferus]